MKKGLSILLIMGMLLTLTAIPSFADEGEKQKPNPDVGVMLQEDPKAPAEVDPEEAKKQQELQKWYDELTEEEREFVHQKMNEKEQEAVLSEEQTRRKEADSLKNYLQKNLSKTQYTYLFNQNGVLEIGVPSAKYISRAKELCTKYTEQTKQDVTVRYKLCRYSIKELEKAKESLEKDKDFTQLMKQVRYALVINNGYLELYCTDETPKKFAGLKRVIIGIWWSSMNIKKYCRLIPLAFKGKKKEVQNI